MLDLESKFAKIVVDLRLIRPFYSSLYETIEKVECNSINTVGVTSSKLYYNKEFLENLDYPEMLFVMLHEIAHIALKHPMRQGNRDHTTFNVACDLYINKLLSEEFNLNSNGESPDSKVKRPSDAQYLDSVNTDKDCAESIYDTLIKNSRSNNDNYIDTSFNGQNISGEIENHLLDDGLDIAEQDNNLNQILSNAITKYDMMNSNNIGKQAGGLEIYVREKLKSHLDWHKLLRKYCIKCRQSDSSFSIPDKRLSYQQAIYPGNTIEESNKLKDVKVFIDTSGSISDIDLRYILGQIDTITKQYKVSFELFCWDTKIQKAYNANSVSTILAKGLAGGGGTEPSCIFKYLDDNSSKNAGLILIFTDAYFFTSDFEKIWNKKYKDTIWVMTKDYSKDFKPPFGKKAIAKFND